MIINVFAISSFTHEVDTECFVESELHTFFYITFTLKVSFCPTHSFALLSKSNYTL